MKAIQKTALCVLPAICCLTACGGNHAIGKNGPTASVGELKPDRVLSLTLDENTPPLTPQIQYVRHDGEECLAMLGINDDTIRFFDIDTGSEIKQVSFLDWTAGRSIIGFSFYGETLYLYNYQGCFLFEIDLANNKVIRSTQVESIRDRKRLMPAAFAGTAYPIVPNGKETVMTGFLSTEHRTGIETRPVVIVLDEEWKDTKYYVEYPSEYDSGNWGGGFFYRMPYSTLGGNDKLVLSFGASESLVVMDLNTKQTREFSAKSRLIDKIRPYKKKSEITPSSPKEIAWYMSNPSYEEVIYNPYTNQYYRIYTLPAKDKSFKPVGIITLDGNMNVISEHTLHFAAKPSCPNFFVTREGLYIQVDSGSEDKMSFALFDSESLSE